MAYIQSACIITRIREIVLEGKGSLRTISAGLYSDGWPEAGVQPDELARRGIATSKPTQIVVRRLGRHPSSPPIGGNLEILNIEVEVATARTIATAEMVDADAEATAKAESMEDVDRIRQALEWPPNLVATEAGAATDLCSLRLDEPASSIRLAGGQGKAYTAEFRLRFEGIALTRPAIVVAAFSSGFDEGFS